MKSSARKNGFSLMELLVTTAIIGILIAAVIGGGQYLLHKEKIRLTEGTIEVVVMALEQYYTEQGEFPEAGWSAQDFYLDELKVALAGYYGVTAGDIDFVRGNNQKEYASSQWMYFCLSKVDESESILNSISETMLTSRDENGTPVELEVSGVLEDNMVRVVDPWGKSFRYIYESGQSFPEVLSAGPDGIFENADDISNK
jgi:prepilin-type N-terminal cleavage/methylation domain-containing protein